MVVYLCNPSLHTKSCFPLIRLIHGYLPKARNEIKGGIYNGPLELIQCVMDYGQWVGFLLGE